MVKSPAAPKMTKVQGGDGLNPGVVMPMSVPGAGH
jgi:hypothetical protein